jgi:quercetin dioxygenase-like cupin family protein
MKQITIRRFEEPDQSQAFADKGRVDVVKVGEVAMARLTLQPGWHWAEHEQPLVGTKSCEDPHSIYVISGRLQVITDEGEEAALSAGDAVDVPAGHDARVLGSEPCVLVSFIGAEQLARMGQARPAAAQQVQAPPAVH